MVASIVTTSMPIFAMLLSALILKEPITGKKIDTFRDRGERKGYMTVCGRQTNGNTNTICRVESHMVGQFHAIEYQLSVFLLIVRF